VNLVLYKQTDCDMFGIHAMNIVGWEMCYIRVVLSILRIEESSFTFISPVIGEIKGNILLM